ncbi:ABC transporter substrate-binding protein [Polaribacter tangerinus]|uniref:ABC transporter substrate-binding protein n=1 Tax=Polaribacter tangerinus TaxID=1920034 RepID=UPI000B4ABC40|nr:ABC transporter substrate-binding protein [Polaribacter tangerinus]
MKHFYTFLSYLLFILISFSCKKEKLQKFKNETSSIKYAKGFDIITDNGIKKLLIKTPYKNATNSKSYTILSKNNKQTNLQGIQTPLKKIVVTSTTHIPMLELLNEEKTIVGFPYTKYISAQKTRKLLSEGAIVEVGKENSLNTEIILSLAPELVVGYSVSSADKSLTTIEKAGIKVIYNGDWLEETPLGRAEWIKFFGVLFNKEKKADSIFNSIEKNYLEAKKIAKKTNTRPTVISGAIMSKDIWSLPGGESFVSYFLEDANLSYLFKNTKGKGSLSLSFETVFDKAKNADFWIAPGYFSTKNELKNANSNYQKFSAYKNDKIYTPTTKKGKTGGVIYYELAPTRPDLVLKDLIKITNPEVLPNYKTTFFEKMK